jgi:hypothetical protein
VGADTRHPRTPRPIWLSPHSPSPNQKNQLDIFEQPRRLHRPQIGADQRAEEQVEPVDRPCLSALGIANISLSIAPLPGPSLELAFGAIIYDGGAGRWRLVMRSALLWIIGVPIPLILLLAYCTGHL